MLEAIAAALASITAVPLFVLILETVAGLRGLKFGASVQLPPRTTVIIPAHNEAVGIANTVNAIKASGFGILVVADNCNDATAAVARAAGAQVVERIDVSLRGKGHALAAGRAALASDPPVVVIIMDADCVPHKNALTLLACYADRTGRAVQARNQLGTRPDDPPMTRISNFAFSLKNVVRQRGLMRIAGTCVLTGTGMAFPWAEFRDAPLATSDSVEDLAIGLALIRARKLPLYVDNAQVSSPPASGKAAVTQRTRWEHGFIATASKVAPQLIVSGIVRLHWSSFWLGLHLLVPPLALVFSLASFALSVLVGLGFVSSFVPAAALAFVIGIAGVAVLGGWYVVGRRILPLSVLLRVPLYIAWKLPIYLKLARGADRRWTRTERD